MTKALELEDFDRMIENVSELFDEPCEVDWNKEYKRLRSHSPMEMLEIKQNNKMNFKSFLRN